MRTRAVRTRVTSALFASVIVVGALSGCTFSAVQANQKPYNPSDGIGETIGNVKVRNALLVTEDGETANLVVNIANEGVQSVQVKVSWEATTGRVERNISIAAGSALGFGPKGNQIILSGVDAEPGTLFPVYFQYGDEEGRDITVPVLNGELKEYADLVPTASQ